MVRRIIGQEREEFQLSAVTGKGSAGVGQVAVSGESAEAVGFGDRSEDGGFQSGRGLRGDAVERGGVVSPAKRVPA